MRSESPATIMMLLAGSGIAFRVAMNRKSPLPSVPPPKSPARTPPFRRVNVKAKALCQRIAAHTNVVKAIVRVKEMSPCC
jgi:hypothetical protein